MTLHDWNRDSKKDWQDGYIEYQICKDMTCQSKLDKQKLSFGSGGDSGKAMSAFGAAVSTIGGLFLFALLSMLLGGAEAVEDMPVVLIIVLWAICSATVACFVGK